MLRTPAPLKGALGLTGNPMNTPTPYQDELAIRHGRKLQIIAVASLVFWLILSSGYDSRLGPATSFYYTMTVHDSTWFCRCPEGSMCYEESMLTDCLEIKIYTKHLVLLSFSVFVYGLMIRKGLASNPVPKIREGVARVRAFIAKKLT